MTGRIALLLLSISLMTASCFWQSEYEAYIDMGDQAFYVGKFKSHQKAEQAARFEAVARSRREGSYVVTICETSIGKRCMDDDGNLMDRE